MTSAQVVEMLVKKSMDRVTRQQLILILKTTLTQTITQDKQFNEDSSLDSEDNYHSGGRNVSHRQVFLKTTLTRTITQDKQFNEDSSLTFSHVSPLRLTIVQRT